MALNVDGTLRQGCILPVFHLYFTISAFEFSLRQGCIYSTQNNRHAGIQVLEKPQMLPLRSQGYGEDRLANSSKFHFHRIWLADKGAF